MPSTTATVDVPWAVQYSPRPWCVTEAARVGECREWGVVGHTVSTAETERTDDVVARLELVVEELGVTLAVGVALARRRRRRAAAKVELADDGRDHATRRRLTPLARTRASLDDPADDALTGRDGEVVVTGAEAQGANGVVLRQEARVDLDRDGALGGRAVLDVDELEWSTGGGEDGAAEAVRGLEVRRVLVLVRVLVRERG